MNLGVPKACFESIAAAFEEAGLDRTMITRVQCGQIVADVVAIDLGDFMVFAEPGDISDICVNAGALSDAVVGACDEAFHAGFRACEAGEDMGVAWSKFTPAEEIVSALHSA